MTSRERLLAAMRLEPVDRLPIHIRGVRPWDEKWLASTARDASYRPVAEVVGEHGDWVDTWGAGFSRFGSAFTDMPVETASEERGEWIVTTTTIHTPAGPLRMAYQSSTCGMPGMQIEFMVKNEEDLLRVLSVPYEPLRPDCSGFFRRDREMGERGIVICSIPNAIANVHDLMGSELLAIWSIERRSLVLELIELFTARCVDLLEHVISQGVGPVFAMLGEEYVTPPMHSARDFRDFASTPEKALAERIHAAGCLLHVHSHGPINDVLEDFADLGANCLHPIEAPPMGNVPLVEAKRRIGDRVCLEGNIQIGDIYAAPTREIVQQVKHNLEVTGGQGYILCPTASPHTPVLPPQAIENYVAMVETAVAWRG